MSATTSARLGLPRLLHRLAAGDSTDTLLQLVAEEGARAMDAETSMCAVILGAAEDELTVRARSEDASPALSAAVVSAPTQLLLTGPVRASVTTGAMSTVTDLQDRSARWPTWVAAAGRAGFRGVRCWPVQVAASPIGAVVVLSTTTWSTPTSHPDSTGSDGHRATAAGQALADVCAIILQLPGPSQRWEQAVTNMQAATARDVAVHQAVGMIAATHSVDIPTAAAALAAHATRTGLAAAELAHQVVAGHVDPHTVALP